MVSGENGIMRLLLIYIFFWPHLLGVVIIIWNLNVRQYHAELSFESGNQTSVKFESLTGRTVCIVTQLCFSKA